MRKFVITLAAAGSALAFAAPAAAQYFPVPVQQPYGYGYGQNNYHQVRVLQARVNRVERQIDRLDRRDAIRDRSADRLRREANQIERRIRLAARNGLSFYEGKDLDYRINRLEQRVQMAFNQRRDRYRWNDGRDNVWGRNADNGYAQMGPDRDRDGLDDRWEDDRGTDNDRDD